MEGCEITGNKLAGVEIKEGGDTLISMCKYVPARALGRHFHLPHYRLGLVDGLPAAFPGRFMLFFSCVCLSPTHRA